MTIIIEAEAKEIAALVVALQERQKEKRVENPIDTIRAAIQHAIDGTAERPQQT